MIISDIRRVEYPEKLSGVYSNTVLNEEFPVVTVEFDDVFNAPHSREAQFLDPRCASSWRPPFWPPGDLADALVLGLARVGGTLQADVVDERDVGLVLDQRLPPARR